MPTSRKIAMFNIMSFLMLVSGGYLCLFYIDLTVARLTGVALVCGATLLRTTAVKLKKNPSAGGGA